jgi:L-alanine-DL-glutamate epimerase-like enolase superfamily enzyme
MKLAHMAELLGLPMAPHFSEEIAVQALCATQNAMLLEHLPGSNLHDSGLLTNSFTLQHGYASPPDKPGHGIVFDWEKLEALTSD